MINLASTVISKLLFFTLKIRHYIKCDRNKDTNTIFTFMTKAIIEVNGEIDKQLS